MMQNNEKSVHVLKWCSCGNYHTSAISIVSVHHANLSYLLNPDQFSRDYFTQYCDMKSMDPVELLSILSTCLFGKFCYKKYFAIVHPKMEESLFGNIEKHNQVQAGNHSRSEF
ncbi:hypothetical protein AHAS_Ahas02G0172000 [Arachis hypogaea]